MKCFIRISLDSLQEIYLVCFAAIIVFFAVFFDTCLAHWIRDTAIHTRCYQFASNILWQTDAGQLNNFTSIELKLELSYSRGSREQYVWPVPTISPYSCGQVYTLPSTQFTPFLSRPSRLKFCEILRIKPKLRF